MHGTENSFAGYNVVIDKARQMGRKIWIILILLEVVLCVHAQKVTFDVGRDSTFNAAEDYAQVNEEFDVDITQLNVINLGAQVAQDVAVASANSNEVKSALAAPSYYRQRVDLMVSSVLPERTNIYSTISFLNDNAGLSSAMVTVTNLEIEHFFRNNFKFRLGRLANSVFESQFFGRMALEESSAHVFGRNLFINDALEFDGSFKKKVVRRSQCG